MSLSHILLLFLLSLSFSAEAAAMNMSAYDVLRSHGLPIGLLPKGVRDFSVDDAGQFRLRLERPCTAKFETEVHYEAEISGTISYGQIASLSGISAQELFLWFPVREIRVDVPSSGLIYFDVGVIHKQFSLSLFDTPPECRPDDTPDPQSIKDGAHATLFVS